MITRLEIALKPRFPDPRGASVIRRADGYLGMCVDDVRTRDVYKIHAELSDTEAQRVLHEFVDPVSQLGALGRLEDEAFDAVVHVGYKPGVTDPVGKSARVAVEDTLGRTLAANEAVYTSRLYMLRGIDKTAAETLAHALLANPLIETIKVRSADEWRNSEPDHSIPEVHLGGVPDVARIDLDVADDELQRISRDGLLSLTLREMKVIRDHFHTAGKTSARRELGLDRRPTDVEIECIAQTWSEHCKHKIFNAGVTYYDEHGVGERIPSLFKDYIRGATGTIDAAIKEREGKSWLISVFHDNAGVIAFDDSIHLVFKVETHNSPSALDPYGGAMTGIVGVNRDPFGTGLGSDLLSNVWGYCFGSPFEESQLPKGLLHPRRIRDGVHQGVIDGGNQSGVPYGRGWEIFDGRYLGKPLVFCGTVGSLPVEIAGGPGEQKAARPGDHIVMAGGRIGADGIHGATFSSAALDESAPVQAVQIGDPITQKILFDFLLEVRERGLYTAITDNGAGGLSSSVGEMAEASGGARMDLKRAPLKYNGLAAWEILISEAQERMTMSVPPEHLEEFMALAKKRAVEAVDLGTFTDDGMLHILYGDETVACLSMEFLHEGDPDLDLTARWIPPRFEEPQTETVEDLTAATTEMLGRLQLCSGERKARHYDHEVKGLSVIKPWVGVEQDIPAEATVFMARHGSLQGYALSEGVHPFLSDLDTHAMAQWSVDLAVRRQICGGARPDRIAILDNFCWPDPVQSDHTPDGEYKMAQLVRACRGLYEAAVAYGTPLVSGKDSMKNDSTMGGVRISIPPTLLVSAIGIVDDVREAVSLDPKRDDDVVFQLGETGDALGGSEFYRWLGEQSGQRPGPGAPAPFVGNRVPTIDPQALHDPYKLLAEAIREGDVSAAAAPAIGGLGVTLAKMCLAANLGMDLDLGPAGEIPTEAKWFSESGGRFVVTVAANKAEAFASRLGSFAVCIGSMNREPWLKVCDRDRSFKTTLTSLRRAYRGTLADV